MLYLPTDDVIAGFAYPPPAIVPFMWLQRLPLGAALLLFTIASYAALLVARSHVALVSRKARVRRRHENQDRGRPHRLGLRADLHERHLRPGQRVRPGVFGSLRFVRAARCRWPPAWCWRWGSG